MSGEQKILGWFGDDGNQYKLIGQPSLNYEPTITNGTNTTKMTLDVSYKCPTYLKESVIKGFEVDDVTITASAVNTKAGGTTSVDYGSGWRLTRLQSPPLDEAFSQINIHYEKEASALTDFGSTGGLEFQSDGQIGRIKYDGSILLEFDSGMTFKRGWEITLADSTVMTNLSTLVYQVGLERTYTYSGTFFNSATGENVTDTYPNVAKDIYTVNAYNVDVVVLVKYNNLVVQRFAITTSDIISRIKPYLWSTYIDVETETFGDAVAQRINSLRDGVEGTYNNIDEYEIRTDEYDIIQSTIYKERYPSCYMHEREYEEIDKTMRWDTSETNKIKLVAWSNTLLEWDISAL